MRISEKPIKYCLRCSTMYDILRFDCWSAAQPLQSVRFPRPTRAKGAQYPTRLIFFFRSYLRPRVQPYCTPNSPQVLCNQSPAHSSTENEGVGSCTLRQLHFPVLGNSLIVRGEKQHGAQNGLRRFICPMEASAYAAAGSSSAAVFQRGILMSHASPSVRSAQIPYQFMSTSYQRKPCRADCGSAW